MPRLWGVLHLGQGSGLHPAARHPVRDWGLAADLAQTTVALQGTAVPACFVHRVAALGDGPLKADDAAAVRARVRGRRTGPGRLGSPPPTTAWTGPLCTTPFAARVEALLAAPLPPVSVLGIDETRRGTPIWAQDPDTKRWVLVCDRWHTGFVDDAAGGLLAQVEGRTSAAAIAWLNAQPEPWRSGITHVTIDLSASYAKAVREALPDAVLVADRFHLVQLDNTMVTDVRQRVIRETEGRRGRTSDPAWNARRRLLTAHERLRPETFAKMWKSLIDTGDAGVAILAMYTVKEALRSLLALAGTKPGTSPDPHPAGQLLPAGSRDRRARGTPPRRHRRGPWWPAIEAGITTGYSNAKSEGYNRLAKHQGRNAFGFHNPVNQRRRIR